MQTATAHLKVSSVVVQTSAIVKVCGPSSTIKLYYKLISLSDITESSASHSELVGGSPFLTFKFTPYCQLKLEDRSDTITFQLYYCANQELKIAEVQFSLPEVRLEPKTLTINFSSRNDTTIGGILTLEILKIEDIFSGFQFKKTTIDIAQLEQESKNAKKIQLPGKKNPAKFKIFGKQKKTRKFGTRLDPTSDEIPEIIIQTITALEFNALSLPGLFRESAPSLEIEDKVKKFEAGKEIFWEQIPNQHIVAGVLMNFLLQLPEPLVTFDLYESFIAAEETFPIRSERVSFVSKLIRTLPLCNKTILGYIAEFLFKLSRNSDVNRMTTSNLAICFGPALMRKEVEDMKQVITDSPLIINIVRLIIEEYFYIFHGGELLISDEEAAAEQKTTKDKSLTQGESKGSPESTLSVDPFIAKLEQFNKAVAEEISVICRNLTLLLSDLDNPTNFSSSDIKRFNLLVYQYHTLLDNPSVGENQLQKDQIISDQLAANVPVRCRELKRAFNVLLERLAGIQQMLKDTIFQDQEDAMKSAKEISQLITRLKSVFDENQRAKGNADQQLQTTRGIIDNIIDKIKNHYIILLQDELEIQGLSGAIAIARVARAIKNALKSKQVEPFLSEKIGKPPRKIPIEPSSHEDIQKLSAVKEVLGYAFTEINSILATMQTESKCIPTIMEARSLIQLLVAVKKFIENYLNSVPPPAPEPAPAPPTAPVRTNALSPALNRASVSQRNPTISSDDSSPPPNKQERPGSRLSRSASIHMDNRLVRHSATQKGDTPESDTAAFQKTKDLLGTSFNEFRSLLNCILNVITNITESQKISSLAAIAVACKNLVAGEKEETVFTNYRKHTQNYTGYNNPATIQRLKELSGNIFEELRGFLFQVNSKITTSQSVSELDELHRKLTNINRVLREFEM